MAEELKACPFCGGEPNLTHSDYVHDDMRPMPVVECKSCSAWVRAEDWNRRAMPRQGGEAVEVVAYLIPSAQRTRAGWDIGPTQAETAECVAGHALPYYVPCMTVAQHQRILAAATHSADQVAEGVVVELRAMLARVIDAEFEYGDWPSEEELRQLLAKSEGEKP